MIKMINKHITHPLELLKLIEKCQKLINYMKFMANLVLIFLYLQNHFFAIISTPALTPKGMFNLQKFKTVLNI